MFNIHHLLFGRQLLYSCNINATVVTKLIVLSSTTDKINRISNHFCDRWLNEYVGNLREAQRTSKLNINFPKINVNDIMLVYDDKVPRHFWRIAIVTGALSSRNSEIREAIVRIAKTNTILKRPLNKLFLNENIYQHNHQTDKIREQKLRREAAVIGETTRKYDCSLREHWGRRSI